MDNHTLKALGIDAGGYNIKTLFNEANSKSEEQALARVKAVLKIYSSWINNQRNKTGSDDTNINIYDLINNQLSPYYNFKKFQIDYQYIITHKELLGYDNVNDDEKNAQSQQDIAVYQSAVYNNNSLLSQAAKKEAGDEVKDSDDIFDAASDFIMDRHDRKKEDYTRFSDKVSGLFFTDNKSLFGNDISGEAATKMAVAQQILDSAYSFIFYSIRIDMNQLVKDEDEEINDEDNYHDYVAEKLIKTIQKIRSTDRRFRSRSNRDGNGTISKFVVSNEYHACFEEEKGENAASTKSQARIVCYVDGIFDELFKNGAKPYSIAKLAVAILPEGYDTDAVCDDLFDESRGSNIRSYINRCAENGDDAALINRVITRYHQTYVDAQSEYSVSYRMFYWPFYKNNPDTFNVLFIRGKLGAQMIDKNEGYKLMDWYIFAQYKDFKQEIINNRTAPFSIIDWNQIRDKSQEKLQAWLECENVRNLVVGDGLDDMHKDKWLKPYGIADGTLITIDHIMSLLFYCNYTAQSYEFSATYRRIYWNETDQSMRQRHGKLAHWARLLREVVDCFGYMMSTAPKNETMYYHGISRQMLFNGCSFFCYGPTSTTIDKEIAFGRFAKEEGMVVDLRKRTVGGSGCTSLFNCSYWSDFTDENERFFLGSLGSFKFKSIHNVKTLENYEGWIKTIATFNDMITGYPYNFGAINNSDTKRLKMLLAQNQSIPDYIKRLWRNITNKVQKVYINIKMMKNHEWPKWNQYAYLLWHDIFFGTDGCIKLPLFIKLFQYNMNQLIIFYEDSRGYSPSISLNEYFLNQLHEFIDYINNNYLKQKFKSLVIINPRIDDVNSFIKDNKDNLINKSGWTLDIRSFYDSQRNRKSERALVIYPIN